MPLVSSPEHPGASMVSHCAPPHGPAAIDAAYVNFDVAGVHPVNQRVLKARNHAPDLLNSDD